MKEYGLKISLTMVLRWKIYIILLYGNIYTPLMLQYWLGLQEKKKSWNAGIQQEDLST